MGKGCLLFGLSVILSIPALLLSGSGGGGPKTYHVSGTVTLDGKPVPAGSILFEPDQSKGNTGPAGFAKIKDGKYDTRQNGRGTVGGPHVVRIIALDGVPAEELPEGTPLAPEYVTHVDLPKENNHQENFNIHASNQTRSAGGPQKPQPDI
ncbi:hypothetical protein THTE_1462 [Thermogutta terrifontis]|uniref:Carboxypeptidase regulatory-like domain-containing protein n=1 Tax=Thermogutta terrifontis TaxID=1331910 RepID=A0A286RDM6_9BACT|nr:hypothetical protein [Thermogutta terrifontis]ASV74064.1 hypothetical protein THTE_1462 [Thermogutta terrifontis]